MERHPTEFEEMQSSTAVFGIRKASRVGQHWPLHVRAVPLAALWDLGHVVAASVSRVLETLTPSSLDIAARQPWATFAATAKRSRQGSSFGLHATGVRSGAASFLRDELPMCMRRQQRRDAQSADVTATRQPMPTLDDLRSNARNKSNIEGVYVCICVYLCISVCISVYLCIFLYICVYLCISVYICVYLCISVYIRACVCRCARVDYADIEEGPARHGFPARPRPRARAHSLGGPPRRA